ncbi:Dol-P-Man:Man(7)GlcNAc(2)-PP-Dol alpha-1,6-mannosyltransferase [Cladobotryum mycophilum]|uniref:Mannosyltransferase n=1 Tax=Cladobotryum mycophilum TaxID=491253 RepID=A0ABR0S613_9HYPO
MHITDIPLFVIPFLHLFVSPYTKVEESFNLQATHDILVYGTPTSDAGPRLAGTYDHFTFPGAVPRTFVGPVLLAGLSQPVVALVGFRHAQMVVRAVLGLFNVVSLVVFRGAVGEAYGEGVAGWWAALIASQFHLAYYLSRTLPNMFAFGLTTLALAFILPKSDPRRAFIRRKQAIGLLVLATTIFRSELAILLSTTGLYLLLSRQLPLLTLVAVFLGTFAAALLLSVPLDSYFWQKPLWPELWGFYYNAVLGSSSNWGVSPWHYYFTSALPRLLLNPLAIPLIVASLALPGTSPLHILRHPPFTGAAALGANYILQRFSKSFVYRLASLCLVLSLAASFAASFLMLMLSMYNYPGGDALSVLSRDIQHNTPPNTPRLAVHADVLTCMTGLTLFGQNPAGLPLALDPALPSSSPSSPAVYFDKTEDSSALQHHLFWQQFDYALMEDPLQVMGDWGFVGQIYGYDGVEVLRPGQVPADEASHGKYDTHALGLGGAVRVIRAEIRKYTGGWWIGPRMALRIHVMRQHKEDVEKK